MRLPLLVFVLLTAGLPAMVKAQDRQVDLEERVREATAGLRGEIGIFARNLATGETVAVNADSLFPTASMVKVPILVGVFDRIEQGALSYEQDLVYRDSLLYPGVDVLGMARDSTIISLGRVVMLMLTLSDNTASLWLQHLAGTGTAINSWLENNGFHSTRVNSRTEGRRGDWERYGWGQTTPREMAELLVMIREGRAVSEDASSRMYRALSRNFWDDVAISAVPPDVLVASKNGAVNRSRSEVLLVHAPGGDYVFCVITKNQEDTSWTDENEGWARIRAVSRVLWEAWGSPGAALSN
jgi:beta-lactamase class A